MNGYEGIGWNGKKGMDLYLMAFMVFGSRYFGRFLAVHNPAITNNSKISSD